MKLLYCPNCQNIVNLCLQKRSCICGKVEGRYVNTVEIEYSGDAVVFGINNTSFLHAIAKQPDTGRGDEFQAFVFPKESNKAHKLN